MSTWAAARFSRSRCPVTAEQGLVALRIPQAEPLTSQPQRFKSLLNKDNTRWKPCCHSKLWDSLQDPVDAPQSGIPPSSDCECNSNLFGLGCSGLLWKGTNSHYSWQNWANHSQARSSSANMLIKNHSPTS